MKTETLTKAAQTADLLFKDLSDAHKGQKGALELILYDLMTEAARIRGKLQRLEKEEGE